MRMLTLTHTTYLPSANEAGLIYKISSVTINMTMLKLGCSFNSVASVNIEDHAILLTLLHIVVFLETTRDTLPVAYDFCNR